MRHYSVCGIRPRNFSAVSLDAAENFLNLSSMTDIRSHLAGLLRSKALTLRGITRESGLSHHTVRNVADLQRGCQTRSIDKVREALERLGHWPPSHNGEKFSAPQPSTAVEGNP